MLVQSITSFPAGLLSPASASPHLCRACLGLPGAPRQSVLMGLGVPQSQPQKQLHHSWNWMDLLLTYPFCPPGAAAVWGVRCSGTSDLSTAKAVGTQLQSQSYQSKDCAPSALAFQITGFTCILRGFMLHIYSVLVKRK